MNILYTKIIAIVVLLCETLEFFLSLAYLIYLGRAHRAFILEIWVFFLYFQFHDTPCSRICRLCSFFL